MIQVLHIDFDYVKCVCVYVSTYIYIWNSIVGLLLVFFCFFLGISWDPQGSPSPGISRRMSKDPSETNEISKVYRDPRGSLEMFGITLREVGALEEGGAKKKHIDTYIYVYMGMGQNPMPL